jgi:hypothetical protein
MLAMASNASDYVDARLSSKVQSQPIVDCFLQILPRSQIALGGLDGGVAQQELNLLEIPTGVVTLH